MKRLILILTLLSWQNVAMATVTLSIDPTTASLGETLHLTLTLDDAQTRALPDLTPLEQDFTVIGTQHSVSYTVINGTSHAANQWIILLNPKRSGTIPIPAIQIGQQASTPSQIKISANQQQENSSEPHGTLLKATVDQPNPFINQQVIYTVKLYTNQRMLEAEYQPPTIEDALLIPLGEGRRYHTTLNHREYAVDEQQYAIFPQKSGELTLVPPALNALVYDGIPKRVQLKAKPIKLTVKPSTASHWLPAKQVILSQKFDLPTTTLNQGDTLVRSINLRAVGFPAQLLPSIPVKNSAQFHVYPEKPTTENTLVQQELVGTSTMNVTYVLNQAGQITLPAITLNWFNTQTGKQETATLPERTLTITANATPTQTPSHKASTPIKRQESSNPTNQNAWWVAGGLALAWAITLVLWWSYPRHRRPSGRRNRGILQDLHFACKANDPIQAKAAVLNWATTQIPTMTFLNLTEIIKHLSDNPALKTQLQLLSQALYSPQSQKTWHGEALWRCIKAYRPLSLAKKKKDAELVSLNPAGL